MNSPSLQDLFDRLIPLPMIPLLHRIGREGERLGIPVYLVGGVVRDLLLSQLREERGEAEDAAAISSRLPALEEDLDLTVEGDAAAFAQHLGPLLGAKAKVHGRFGTANLEFPDGSHVDLTTSRSERYPKPGALPVVEPAPLRDDLFRRDFTVNAMALRLGETSEEMLDPFHGRDDLQSGRLRVLHPMSFVDDPTRIMRGARFEARFGFRMEPETLALAEAAVREERLGTVSKDRFRREMMLGLAEAEPWGCAARWDALGVLDYLRPGLRADGERLRSTAETLRWFASLRQRETPDRTLLLLAALLSTLSPADAEGICDDRLGLPIPKNELLLRCLERGPELARIAGGADPPALTKALKSEKLEVGLFAATLDPLARERLAAYFQLYRHTKLAVTGDDLIGMGYSPGPEMGAALQAALDEKIRGRLKTRRKELDFLVEHLGGGRSGD